MVIKSFYLAVLLLLVTGCSQRSIVESPQPITTVNAPTEKLAHRQGELLAQYSEWQGTPHKWGGMSKRGIDCSGLVKLTFEQRFSVSLPRTTASQVEVGKSIKRSQLRTGDLVFFKTGVNVRHVGIMVDEAQFFHASSSRGVIISRLDNPYWKSHYWQSRRVDF